MAMRGGKPVLLWGGTGQAKVLREALQDSGYEVVVVFDNDQDCEPPFSDVPLFRGWSEFARWREGKDTPQKCSAAVAIGGDKGRDRVAVQRALVGHGILPLTVIHSTAFVAGGARIGAGSQVLANASVCAEAVLGEACIINTAASVDHECRLGDGVHIAPGAHLAGLVNAGSYSTIFMGAVVLPRINIGEGAIVAAGSVVISDVDPYTIVAGNPARLIRRMAEKCT